MSAKSDLKIRYDAVWSTVDTINKFKQFKFKNEIYSVEKQLQDYFKLTWDWSGTEIETQCEQAIEILEAFLNKIDAVCKQDLTSFDI